MIEIKIYCVYVCVCERERLMTLESRKHLRLSNKTNINSNINIKIKHKTGTIKSTFQKSMMMKRFFNVGGNDGVHVHVHDDVYAGAGGNNMIDVVGVV